MPKRTKTMCNICFDEPNELKCNECTYECCYKCIIEWSNKSHNCPLCGRFETYDIEYFEKETEEESIFDYDIFDPDPDSDYEEQSEEQLEENQELLSQYDQEEIEEVDEYTYPNYTLDQLLAILEQLPPPPPPDN